MGTRGVRALSLAGPYMYISPCCRSLAGSQCLREAGSRASLASTSGRPWAASASRHAPAGLRAEIPAVKLAKASFTSVVSEESKLTSSEIQQLLDAAGVDYRFDPRRAARVVLKCVVRTLTHRRLLMPSRRDCVEKQDLILRLREAQPRLPPYVRARLSALLNSRGAGAVTQQPTSVPAEVVQDLSPEELGSIAVFKTCSKSAGEPRAYPLRVPAAPFSAACARNPTSAEPSRAAVHITTHAAVQRPFSTDIMEIPAGTGSGFVWDDQGHIVTNYHVVQRMSRGGIIRATLSDGTVVPAQIVGVEPERDLAVLRALETPQRGRLSGWVPVVRLPDSSAIRAVASHKRFWVVGSVVPLCRVECSACLTARPVLHPQMLGSSGKLQVGQRVFAIGNPFGLDQTLTTGIVSGLGREVTGVAGNKARAVGRAVLQAASCRWASPLTHAHSALADPRRDPDGRGHQPRQLRRAPAGFTGPSHRGQHDDLLDERHVRGGRVRDPRGHGAPRRQPADQVRPRAQGRHRGLLPPGCHGEVRGAVRRCGRSCRCPDQRRKANRFFLPCCRRNLGRDGVVVQSVMKGSGADQAGLHGLRTDASGRVVVMDEIIAVGGERVHTVEDLMTALEAFDAG